MSTDPTKPTRAPAQLPEEPEADADQPAPPTVQVPVVKAPSAPEAGPAQPAPPRGQEPPTQAVPKWQAPPPPPPPPPAGPRAPQGQPDQAQAAPPTRIQAPPPSANPAPPTPWGQPQTPPDPVPPTQWDQPQQTKWDQPGQAQWDQPQPTLVDKAPPTPQNRPQQPPQPWQQPQWQQEPRDDRPAQWPPQPPQPPQSPQPQRAAAGWQQQAPPNPEQWEIQTPTGLQPTPPVDQPPVNQALADQQPRFRRRRRKRRVRRSVMALFTVIVILILLVIGDRVALAITENAMASQFQQNGLPVKPSVTIEGFPFLTQLVAKDFNKVDISASNVPVPLPTGGSLSITSVHATIDGLHISSYSSTASARVDQMNATAFVSFGALAAAGGIGGGTGITVTPVNANTVKISANLGGIFSDSEEAQITTTAPQTISVKVLPSGGALGSVLSSFGSFSFNLPKGVPPSLRITNLTLNDQGLTISAAATNATFSQ